MKVFFTFLALLTVCLSLICFTADMDRYEQLQLHLKAVAEECAGGSVLFTDPEYYAGGLVVFREDYARDYVDFLLDEARESYASFRNGNISAEIILFDDEKGYSGINEYGIKQQKPCGVVTLTWTGTDIFRLPFLEMTCVSRTAVYEWEEQGF